MKNSHTVFIRAIGLLALFIAGWGSQAFSSQNRVSASADMTQRVAIEKSTSSLISASTDLGRLNPTQNLGRIVLTLAPTATQDKAAAELVRAQHNQSSGQFHKWLTPSQFGEKFGVVPQSETTG